MHLRTSSRARWQLGVPTNRPRPKHGSPPALFRRCPLISRGADPLPCCPARALRLPPIGINCPPLAPAVNQHHPSDPAQSMVEGIGTRRSDSGKIGTQVLYNQFWSLPRGPIPWLLIRDRRCSRNVGPNMVPGGGLEPPSSDCKVSYPTIRRPGGLSLKARQPID